MGFEMRTKGPSHQRAAQGIFYSNAPTLGGVSPYSCFLFPLPSFLFGLARVFDLGAQLDSYNVSITPNQADSIALSTDWMAASTDVREATIDSLTEYLKGYLESDEGKTALRDGLHKLHGHPDTTLIAR